VRLWVATGARVVQWWRALRAIHAARHPALGRAPGADAGLTAAGRRAMFGMFHVKDVVLGRPENGLGSFGIEPCHKWLDILLRI